MSEQLAIALAEAARWRRDQRAEDEGQVAHARTERRRWLRLALRVRRDERHRVPEVLDVRGVWS